jgi:hypothetical protein
MATMSDNNRDLIGLKKIVAANERYAIGYAELNHKGLTLVKYRGDGWESTVLPDARGQTCQICRRTWTNDIDDLRNVLSLGDREEFRLVHETCFIGHLTVNEFNLFRNSLCAVNLWTNSIVAIPNEYKGAWDTDWFVASLKEFYPIKIKFGRRKRVWEIEATGEFNVPKDFLKSEDVTKEFSSKSLLIHAGDEAKIVEYLKAFKEIFVPGNAPNMYNISE